MQAQRREEREQGLRLSRVSWMKAERNVEDPRRKVEHKARFDRCLAAQGCLRQRKVTRQWIWLMWYFCKSFTLWCHHVSHTKLKVERCSDGTGWKLAFPERLLKNSTANVTKIEMAPWQHEGLRYPQFDGFESSEICSVSCVVFWWWLSVIPRWSDQSGHWLAGLRQFSYLGSSDNLAERSYVSWEVEVVWIQLNTHVWCKWI